MKTKILVTGASGFVGSHVVEQLLHAGHSVICASRSKLDIAGTENVIVGDINSSTVWKDSLDQVHTVIHCAARVHVMNDTATDPLRAFREVNLDGSLRLATECVHAGVSQFIYLSSIKVNGEVTRPGKPFTELDPSMARDPYGISKMEAEQALLALGARSGLGITIIRPPLVYGRGVAANFLSLLRWVKKQIPLPLASIHNQRSFVFVKNLAHFITHCVQNPVAYQEVFLISDGQDLSTTELLQKAAHALQVPSRLMPFPASLIQLGATLIGKKAISDRLCQSLQVDSSKARQRLQWRAPYSIEQGLIESACFLATDDTEQFISTSTKKESS